jgi:hypothetical protein
VKERSDIPKEAVNRFFQNVETRAWTEAEKELDIVRQKIVNTPWCKGYVKALEGLMLTYKTNDDKYIYLPRALSNRSEESINQLRKQFEEFATSEIHGEYDRGYFKALEEYVSMLSTSKTNPQASPVEPSPNEKAEEIKKDEGLTKYLAES